MQFNRVDTSGNLFKYGPIYVYLHTSVGYHYTSLTTLWSDGGQYLFVPPDTPSDDDLHRKIKEFFLLNASALFVWVENPHAPLEQWKAMQIKSIGPRVNWKQKIDTIKLYLRTGYRPAGKELFIDGYDFQNNVTCVEDGFVFESLSSTSDYNNTINFILGEFVNVDSYVKNVKLKLDNKGCSFTYQVENVGGFEQHTHFDEIGLWYTVAQADKTGQSIPVQTVQYRLHTDTLLLFSSGRVNPLDLLTPEQTYLSLKSNINNQLKPVSLVTSSGTHLKALITSDSKLVYQTYPRSLYYDETGKLAANKGLYLTFSGHYTIPASGAESESILCGLSGTEYVAFNGKQDSTVEFKPGCNAFIDLRENAGSQLSDLATTAWIRFPEDIQYYNSSEAAKLYIPRSDGMFSYQDYRLSEFHGRSPAVPMGLYSDCKSNLPFEEIRKVEDRIYKARHAILSNGALPVIKPSNNNTTLCATPQGLMVGVNESGDWEWIGLAEVDRNTRLLSESLQDAGVRDCMSCLYGGNPSGNSDAPKCPHCQFDAAPIEPEANYPQLRMERLSSRLCGLLRQKQIFILFESPEDFLCNAIPSQDFKLSYDCWTFELDPRKWRTGQGNSNTAMILKYAPEHTLRELAADSPVFRQSLAQAYEADGSVKRGFEGFAQIVDDPHFQGVLFLNCPVSVEKAGLQPELAAALNGLDLTGLTASYFVLRANKIITKADGKVYMEPSSAFGSMRYEGKRIETLPEQEQLPAAQYSVVKMNLEIQNSEIASFQLEAELLVNTLFGSSCTVLDGTRGDCLLLEGAFHKGANANTMGEYVFTLREKVEYRLPASALHAVLMEDVHLSIDAAKNSVFTLGGRLLFGTHDSCDLFSYGREAGKENDPITSEGLRFGGLRILLSSEGAARLDTRQLALHPLPDHAGAREKSFAACFACTADSLAWQTDGKTPEDLGFRSITCPVDQDELQQEWCGVVWKIPLGNLGALTKGEAIHIELLTAWSADETGEYPALYIGAKLPAALGGDGLDLQGLIKLGFHTISLEAEDPEAPAAGAPPRIYRLILHNFALRLLGLGFPPGSNKIFLVSDGKGVGWYAGYSDE